MADNPSGRIAETKKHSTPVDFMIRLVKEKPLGTVGLVMTLLAIVTAIFADFLAPYGMNETGVGGVMVGPSSGFWLGTDNLGRDMLSRIIFGARISVIVGLVASTLATTLSVIIGMISGYIGGKFDMTVQRFVDAFMCFPGLILLIVLISVIGPGMVQVILVIGVSWGIIGSRVIRGAVISIKENVYIEAARAIGCSTTRILIRHIVPNIMGLIIVLLTTRIPGIILAEASLSFLGYGIPPPAPSWGGMLSGSGRKYMFQAPWMVIWPGLALALVVYGVNMFGDAVRDILDPRLRGGVGQYGVRVGKGKPQKSEPSTQRN